MACTLLGRELARGSSVCFTCDPRANVAAYDEVRRAAAIRFDGDIWITFEPAGSSLSEFEALRRLLKACYGERAAAARFPRLDSASKRFIALALAAGAAGAAGLAYALR